MPTYSSYNSLGSTIDAGELSANAITATEIASDAVETAKIKNANVTAAKLASDAVETAKILNANVTQAKLESSQLMFIETGNYTGDGSTDQTITLAEANLTPLYIVVYEGVSGANSVINTWIDEMGSNLCHTHTDSGATPHKTATDRIISAAKGNFHVDDAGGDNDPNKNTATYWYMVIGTYDA